MTSSIIEKYCFHWNNQTMFPTNVPNFTKKSSNIQPLCHYVAGLFYNEVICFD